MKKIHKNRKGYTLVELVIVILVIAVLAAATFLGGAAVIRNSQNSRTQSDLHSFEVAAQSLLYQHTELATAANTKVLADIAKLMNERLSADLQFADAGISAKKDAWDKPYTMSVKRTADLGHTSYAIVVWSMGNDANKDTKVLSTTGNWKDDKGVVILYTDGDVSVQYFGFDGSTATADATNSATLMGKATTKLGVYAMADSVINP